VFEVMSVFALMQHCNRSISEARTFLNLRTDCRTCRNNSLLHIFKVWALPDIQCFLMFIKKVEQCYVRWTNWPRNRPTAFYSSIKKISL